MTRTADYTIQGFLYQFNKTILEILKAQNNNTITCEGIIEDIEVMSPELLTAIQCKYHEASTSFTPSAIYRPLLQMLKHFSDNPTANIHYVLFAHFPNVSTPPPIVNKDVFKAALSTTDKDLQKYIINIPKGINLDDFEAKFAMEFGLSYDEIVAQVGHQLEENGFQAGEIETLAYPNAIHIIATLSTRHNTAERQITRKDFLFRLKRIRTTAISRWTLALSTRKKILEAKRKQLKIHLDKNSRLRYFIIDPTTIKDYQTEIVLFVTDYIDRYHFKPAHISTPILCLCVKKDEVQDIQRRLFAKNIVAEDGYIGGEFQEFRFFRDPMSLKKGGTIQREFALRILSWDEHGLVLNRRKCDDMFIIGEPQCEALDSVDVNIEQLAGATIKELKFMMGVSNVYD